MVDAKYVESKRAKDREQQLKTWKRSQSIMKWPPDLHVPVCMRLDLPIHFQYWHGSKTHSGTPQCPYGLVILSTQLHEYSCAQFLPTLEA